MPRLTAESTAARRARVLSAAQRCFARDGFAGTSMQHICTEADMSPGAIYGYFTSKEELITAVMGEVLDYLAMAFDDAVAHSEPSDITGLLTRLLTTLADPENGPDPRLAVQMWAESLTNSTLAIHLAEVCQRQQHRLAAILARTHPPRTAEHPTPVTNTTPTAYDMAAVLTALGPAFLLHHALLPESITAQSFSAGLVGLLNPATQTLSPRSPSIDTDTAERRT